MYWVCGNMRMQTDKQLVQMMDKSNAAKVSAREDLV
jgi:hypothetical protein